MGTVLTVPPNVEVRRSARRRRTVSAYRDGDKTVVLVPSRLTKAEEEQLALTPLRDIVGRVAELTGMKFFSSEVALTESGEFVLIDYVNDQCHMLSQSANPQMGVPNELVSAIARRLVEGVSQMVKR